MSEVESEVLSVPINDQVRLALIYIGKFLEKINRNLEQLNSTLADICVLLEGSSGGRGRDWE